MTKKTQYNSEKTVCKKFSKYNPLYIYSSSQKAIYYFIDDPVQAKKIIYKQ